MPSNPAKSDGRSHDDLAGNGIEDEVATTTDLRSWRWTNTNTNSSLRSCSGDYQKYARQDMGHQPKQSRYGGFTGKYWLFSNFFQN
jgi:hypothetical protein